MSNSFVNTLGLTIICTLWILVSLSPQVTATGILFSALNENKPEKLCDRDGWYYDNVTAQCYEGLSQGPCAHNMKWYQHGQFPQLGGCDCRLCTIFPITRSNTDAQCYPLYTKANCKYGEWFVKYADVGQFGLGRCTPNPCLSEKEPLIDWNLYIHAKRLFGFEPNPWDGDRLLIGTPTDLDPTYGNDEPIWYLHEDRCYKTFTKGHCEGEDELVVFWLDSRTPTCYKVELSTDSISKPKCGGVVLTTPLVCSAGYRRHGHVCIPNL